MSDPVLDEDLIIAHLQAPCTVEYLTAIQGGAVQALCDVYDRKVTRDEFVDAAAKCLTLYGQSMKLWLLDNIHGVFQNGALTESSFKEAEARMGGLLRAQCETVIEMVKRLQECPTSRDRIN
jgi:hypothetical protein